MTDATFPQCRIVPLRMLKPETSERLLTAIAAIPGIRRIMVNGPGLPATVPYGPARGSPNPNTNRQSIRIGDTDLALRVQVANVVIEMENASVVDALRELCDGFFTAFPYQLQTGRFMKNAPSLVDYTKYGPGVNPDLIGLADPRSRDGPVLLRERDC
ncbi:methyl-coenzyme M reductase operon protein D [Methanoculleus sp. FWC-SCC1]|uniref:Methyl-coenzyme M reductase operon protein D n=1 Tax=Methanoculleus frigidifontis TaxID=2584085 RepID=A0ABT8M9J0_9EURY|nr:methyl-coenzyme M reductase operon protein D [Methanoculleus sp. FWC-SCC1]MDN7024598.1 methyl-coenzyme M reductase operon protein D [Methanoculleus sp. FWC-SCC1]